MLWQIEIYPAEGQPDLDAQRVAADAADLGIARQLHVQTARGYLIQGPADAPQIQRLAPQLLADGVVERTRVAPVGDAVLSAPGRSRRAIPAVGPRAAQTGRDGPGRSERPADDRRLRRAGRRDSDLSQVLGDRTVR